MSMEYLGMLSLNETSHSMLSFSPGLDDSTCASTALLCGQGAQTDA